MIGEEQGRLTSGIPCAYQMNIETMGRTSLTARSPIVNSLANHSVKSVDIQTAPGHASCQNDCSGVEDFITVEEDFARCRGDPLNRPGDQYFRAETPRLLKRAACEFVTGYPAWKAEIVFNARGCTGLAAGSLPFNHDGA